MKQGDKVKFKVYNESFKVWFSYLNNHYPSLEFKKTYVIRKIWDGIGIRITGEGLAGAETVWFDKNWLYAVPEPTVGFTID